MNLTAPLLALLLATPAPRPTATVAPAPVPAPAFTANGAFFALSVADLKASTQWYSERFGMTVILETPPFEGGAAVVLEGAGPLAFDRAAMPFDCTATSLVLGSPGTVTVRLYR